MKIMLYSQHVLGIGHFFRSMEIAKALSSHDVMFVEGGDPLPGFVPPPHVRRFFLPSLMMDTEFKTMETREGSLDEIKAARKRQLMDCFLQFAPDILITELFPFGRKQFRFELMPILEAIRKETRSTRVICSLRDILVEKKDQDAYEKGVLEILNTCYHHLLIHSDPAIIPLDETFRRMSEIRIPVHYTGFVVRRPPVTASTAGSKTILASSGGGRVGIDLLAATILAVQRLSDPDIRLRVFEGPFMEEDDREHLIRLTRQDPRTTMQTFSLDFLAELARADLSVSMAGYNTCMDILSSGVKALVYPFPQNREQSLRAHKLEEMGILGVLRSLDIPIVSAAIHTALERPPGPAAKALNLSGAANTAVWVEKHVGNH